MIDVSALKYNGNVCTGLDFNGNSVQTLILNGNYRWGIASGFDIIPFFVTSEHRDVQPTIYFNRTYPYHVNYHHTFIVKNEKGTIYDINITCPSNYNLLRFFPIDNFAFMARGGEDPGKTNTINRTYTFSRDNVSQELNFRAIPTEAGGIYHEGLYLNKVVRVPSGGGSGTLYYDLYPYNFDSELYDESYNVKPWYFDQKERQKCFLDEDGYYKYYYNYQIIKSCAFTDLIFSSLNAYKQGLKVTLNYTVTTNTTNSYRDVFMLVGGNGDTGVHFVQEPYSNNRVYFGRTPTGYNTDYPYTLISQLGSCVLSGTKEIINTWESDNTKWCLMYPDDITNRFSITTDGSSGYTDSFHATWDGILYTKVNNIPKTTKYIFTPL